MLTPSQHQLLLQARDKAAALLALAERDSAASATTPQTAELIEVVDAVRKTLDNLDRSLRGDVRSD